MEQGKQTCPACGKQGVIYRCSGCSAEICELCHHLELAGSGCGTVIPLYYCPNCAFDENINPNACLKDEW
jgi:hypothetical protein